MLDVMFMPRAKRLGASLANILLPPQCVFCGQSVLGQFVCDGCHHDLPWITNSCERCGTPIATQLPAGTVCGKCQLKPPPFETTLAPLHYDFPIDAAIKALKFGRKLFLAPALASLALEKLLPVADSFDALVPVPLYRWRHATRGFNQAHELAKFLKRCCGLPIRRCVTRARRTAPQSGLNAAARKRNMTRAFVLVDSPACDRILIVDDVMTTGETCRAMASVLREGGVKHVSVLIIAHASL